MRARVIFASLGLIVGTAIPAVAATFDDSSTPRLVPDDNPSADSIVPAATPVDVFDGLDTSGNCDEAEHANDPECAGVSPLTDPATPTTDSTPGASPAAGPTPDGSPSSSSSSSSSDDSAGNDVDISGNCDEAEHANDPECNGTAPARIEDNSSSGSDDSGRGRGRGRGGDDDDRDDSDDHWDDSDHRDDSDDDWDDSDDR
jgi:hypothetical protein